jgi:PHD/YefM family antitoxin component YafN of YafNO toxin-antitoxin module
MKTINLSDATAPLAEYVKQMEGEPITIMHKGVALAVLAPAGNDDYESVQMSTNPEFIALLEKSRKSIREGRSFSGEEARKLFLEDDKDN